MAIHVHALNESSYLKPDGDAYAPQVIAVASRRGWSALELNTNSLPFDADYVLEVLDRLSYRTKLPDPAPTIQRFFRIWWNLDVNITGTHGYSQGDYGASFVFVTPEYLEITGRDIEAYPIDKLDHNDLCMWLWGDVYEVFSDEICAVCGLTWGGDGLCSNCSDENGDPLPNPELDEDGEYTEECPMIVYGMEQASEYGEIEFPKTLTTVYYH